jgi:flagellar basal body-associated protein FliL
VSVEVNGALRKELAQLRTEFRTELEDTEGAREKTRGRIALILIATLIVVVVATFAYILLLSTRFAELGSTTLIATIQTVGVTILTPLVGLIGAVTGFYYGGQTAVQAASQGAQATRAATRATTEAATQVATEAATDAATMTGADGFMDPDERRAYARSVETAISPAILLSSGTEQSTEAQAEVLETLRQVSAYSPETRADWLYEAMEKLSIPDEVPWQRQLYTSLATLAALYAWSQSTSQGEDLNSIYMKLPDWVCDNFYPFFRRWNCND